MHSGERGSVGLVGVLGFVGGGSRLMEVDSGGANVPE